VLRGGGAGSRESRCILLLLAPVRSDSSKEESSDFLFLRALVSTHLFLAELERLGRAAEAERGVVLWLQGSCNTHNLSPMLAHMLR
jgi:hypothetical protein